MGITSSLGKKVLTGDQGERWESHWTISMYLCPASKQGGAAESLSGVGCVQS